jgi:outer membrane protein OmpA-like peptidoglycan-associated protein
VRALAGSFALLGALVMLTSCSDSWPDSLDPSDWYATGVGEDVAPTSDEPVPGADQDYPNLAEVPDAPANVSTPEQIDAVANALSADLANAQYSSDLQRADDETTPQAMPLPQPEVVEVAEETTYIEPGGEIAIAEAQVMPVPEEVATPEPEAQAAMEAEAIAVAEMEQPQPEPMEVESLPVVESRVETETIRGEDGELVGTVTRVVMAEPVVMDVDDEPVAETVVPEVAVPAEPMMEPVAVAEPAAEIVVDADVAENTVVVAQPPAEPAMEPVAEPAAAVAEVAPAAVGAQTMEGQSLVAMSERDPDQPIDVAVIPDQVVVVPEYVAELAPAEVTPLDEPAAAMPATTQEAMQQSEMAMAGSSGGSSETRIEQQTVVDNASGELVGSITRTVEVTTVMQAADARDQALVAEEPEMSFTEVAETLASSAEPQAAVQPVTTSVPEVIAVTQEPVATQALDFNDMIVASGPDAGTGGEPIVIASSEPVAQTEAVFTTQPGAPVNEVLAAIIRFGDGSSALGSAERDIVRQLVLLHAERGGHIRLVGHASKPAGGMETAQQELVNFNISLDRATAVAEELIRQGVPRNDVMVEAAGDNQASSDAAQDRRVDVLFGA